MKKNNKKNGIGLAPSGLEIALIQHATKLFPCWGTGKNESATGGGERCPVGAGGASL